MRVEERRKHKADQSLFIFRDTKSVHPGGGCARARADILWDLPHGEKLGEICLASPVEHEENISRDLVSISGQHEAWAGTSAKREVRTIQDLGVV